MRGRPLLASAAILAGVATLLGGAARAVPEGEAGAPPRAEPSAEPALHPYVEELKDGYVDWGGGIVAAWGRAVHLAGEGRTFQVSSSRIAAEEAARKRLIEIAEGLRATSDSRVGDLPGLREKISGIVKRTAPSRERRRNQFVEMLVVLSLRGPEGLTQAVQEAVRAGGGSGIAPPPEAGPERAAGAPPAPIAAGAPTGIVIDARDSGIGPALLPRILDDSGAVIVSPETVRAEALRLRGMVAYVREVGQVALSRDRIGEAPLWVHASAGPATVPAPGAPPSRAEPRPYRLRAASASGPLKADIVLGRPEAERLRSSPEAMNLIKECRVLVIVAGLGGSTRSGAGSAELLQVSALR